MIKREMPGTQVIDRACTVLNCFNFQNQSLSLAEIVRMTNLHTTTAHRIMQALLNAGMLYQDPQTSRYSLGYALMRLGEIARQSNDLVKVSQRHIVELSKRWGEATVIDVPDRDLKMISVAIQTASYRLATSSTYDIPPWPHCTAAGKAILAFLPADEVEQFLAQKLPAYTPNTITDPDVLTMELSKIRKNGFATNFEEQEPGLVAVAAPILSGNGRVIAALSIGGPSVRMTPNLREIIETVVETANRISFDLGFDQLRSQVF